MTHGERLGDHCNQAEHLVCRALTRMLVERPDDVSLAAPIGAIRAGVRLLVRELPHDTSREVKPFVPENPAPQKVDPPPEPPKRANGWRKRGAAS